MFLTPLIAQALTEPPTAAVIVASVAGVGNIAMWIRLENRLTRIETRLEVLWDDEKKKLETAGYVANR